MYNFWVAFITFVFLPSLVCSSEVNADVHWCVSACPSLLFFPGCILFINDMAGCAEHTTMLSQLLKMPSKPTGKSLYAGRT